MKKLFIAGTKKEYKNINGISDIFSHFGYPNKPLSDRQILYIIFHCFANWLENEPVSIDLLMDYLYDAE